MNPKELTELEQYDIAVHSLILANAKVNRLSVQFDAAKDKRDRAMEALHRTAQKRVDDRAAELEAKL